MQKEHFLAGRIFNPSGEHYYWGEKDLKYKDKRKDVPGGGSSGRRLCREP